MRSATGFDQVDLLGHSWGGLLGMIYAFERPDSVARLVLVDPDPATRSMWEAGVERLRTRTSPEDANRMAEIAADPGWGQDPGMMEEWFAIRLRAYMSDPAAAGRIDLHFDEMTVTNFLTTPAIIRADLGDWDLRADLAGIRAPTLIVAGGDSVFPHAALEDLVAAIPHTQLEILDDAGHFPFIEAPHRFADLVLSFLER
jgi:pimeloyl-ACP methyl ester carboxylesterase